MSETRKVTCPHCGAVNLLASTDAGNEPVCSECQHSLLQTEPLELTADNFDHHLNNSDLPILVDFWAPWCGPCRRMGPVIDAAVQELKTVMRVAKLNTETQGEITARFGIRSIPTLIVFHQGEIVRQHSGTIDLAALVKWAKSAIA